MKTDRVLKYIAVAALESYTGAYGRLRQADLTLLESNGEGTYILFKYGGIEYRFESYMCTDESIWCGEDTITRIGRRCS